MRRVCFYHAGCPDGFGAAWAVWKAWGDEAEYRPRGHGDPLESAAWRGAEVIFADLTPDNAKLAELGEVATRLVVLDHHASALERVAADPGLENRLAALGHEIRLDLERCGAVLAWRFFHPETAVPELLRYIEDMDLWRWKLPRSREVNAAISAYPRRFEVWEALSQQPVEALAEEGEPIVRAQRLEIEQSLKAAHPITLESHRLEAVNATSHRAWIGHALAQRAAYGVPCGVVYRMNGRRVDVSIYSVDDFDVGRLAARFGGGGHRHAAGFQLAIEEWIRLLH